MAYRPDIDGLRAIAVLAVFVFHLWPSILPSGYLGVDVFFVISGYLITLLILKEREENRFSFSRFWTRRIKRLAPALMVMISISMLMGWFFRLPEEYSNQALVGLLAIFGVSNLYFGFQQQDYFDSDIILHPYLHTWSLGVEEQFYLVFPFLIAIVWRWKFTGVLTLLLGITILSFLSTHAINNSSLNYYAPWARAWQLAAGSLLAWMHATGRMKAIPRPGFWRNLGLTLIIFSCMGILSEWHNSSWMTLTAVLGTLAIIAAGHGRSTRTVLLSSQPMVFIGLTSYSLYLWHQPLIVYYKNLIDVNITPAAGLTIFLLAVIISTMSLFYVERPFRNYEIRPVSVMKFFSFVLLGSVFSLSFVWLEKGVNERIPNYVNTALFYKTSEHIHARKCHLTQGRVKRVEDFSFCGQEQHNPNTSIYLWGNSHAASLASGFYSLDSAVNFAQRSISKCHGIQGVEYVVKGSEFGCIQANDYIHKEVSSLKTRNRILVLHNRWSEGISGKNLILSGSKTPPTDVDTINFFLGNINNLLDEGFRIVLVDPVPEHKGHVPDSLARHLWYGRSIDNMIITRANYEQRHQLILNAFDTLDSPNLLRIKVKDIFCPEQERFCLIKDELGRPLYFDDDHLSSFGAMILAEHILVKMQERWPDLALSLPRDQLVPAHQMAPIKHTKETVFGAVDPQLN